jgi:hypothetical protein
MSTYERLICRRRAALRLEMLFVVAVAIIASATAQIAF